jgi:hypothetical protein
MCTNIKFPNIVIFKDNKSETEGITNTEDYFLRKKRPWTIEDVFNHLKTKRRQLYLKSQHYRAVNTFHLGYKNQLVYAVSGTSRWDKDEAQTALFKDPVRTAL